MLHGVVTGSDGSLFIPSDLLGLGPSTVEFSTPGTLDHWPVRASVAVG